MITLQICLPYSFLLHRHPHKCNYCRLWDKVGLSGTWKDEGGSTIVRRLDERIYWATWWLVDTLKTSPLWLLSFRKVSPVVISVGFVNQLVLSWKTGSLAALPSKLLLQTEISICWFGVMKPSCMEKTTRESIHQPLFQVIWLGHSNILSLSPPHPEFAILVILWTGAATD